MRTAQISPESSRYRLFLGLKTIFGVGSEERTKPIPASTLSSVMLSLMIP
jgi:hypothetical protein